MKRFNTILELFVVLLALGCGLPMALQSPAASIPSFHEIMTAAASASIKVITVGTEAAPVVAQVAAIGTKAVSAIMPDTTGLPNNRLTPGSIDPRVTQADIHSTICRKGGYTSSVRPPVSYTEPLKISDIKLYGYADRRASQYEMDHLVPLELGGNPTNPKNLWPEPHHIGNWGSYVKDNLENKLHDLVCSGRLSLGTAQQAIATDWVAAYKQYMGN